LAGGEGASDVWLITAGAMALAGGAGAIWLGRRVLKGQGEPGHVYKPGRRVGVPPLVAPVPFVPAPRAPQSGPTPGGASKPSPPPGQDRRG